MSDIHKDQANLNANASSLGLPSEQGRVAIVLLRRPQLRQLVKQVMQQQGIAEIFTADTPEDAIALLKQKADASLVIDYDFGVEAMNQVLSAAQAPTKVDTRPILMLASELNAAVVGVSADYGVAQIHTGELSRASFEECFSALLAAEAESREIRAKLSLVASCRRRGDWHKAGTLLAEIQAAIPEDPRISCELVENMLHEDKWDEASAVIETLTLADGDNIRLNHLKARVLLKYGRTDEAIHILESCQLINPFYVDRLIDLGNALMQAQRHQQALKAFEDVLAIDSTNESAKRGQVSCKLLQDDLTQALRLLKQMSSPRETASLFNTAAVLAIRQGRFEHGMKLYRTALATLGSQEALAARLVFNLGLAYLKNAQLPRALDCFELACDMDRSFTKAKHNALALASRLSSSSRNVGVDGLDDEERISHI